jgi:hypothetical protein
MTLRKSDVKTITYDIGLEFAMHGFINDLLGCESYFCKPYSSWERRACKRSPTLEAAHSVLLVMKIITTSLPSTVTIISTRRMSPGCLGTAFGSLEQDQIVAQDPPLGLSPPCRPAQRATAQVSSW